VKKTVRGRTQKKEPGKKAAGKRVAKKAGEGENTYKKTKKIYIQKESAKNDGESREEERNHAGEKLQETPYRNELYLKKGGS